MATNLALDDKVIEEAVHIGGHKSKREAVMAALREYIQHRRQLEILELAGKISYDPDYDIKALRKRGIRRARAGRQRRVVVPVSARSG